MYGYTFRLENDVHILVLILMTHSVLTIYDLTMSCNKAAHNNAFIDIIRGPTLEIKRYTNKGKYNYIYREGSI